MSAERSPSDSYDAFLHRAIQLYWERGGHKTTFVALLLATREAWAVAADKTFQRETSVKVLRGVAGAAGITVLLRLFLGGPIGILLTGASVVSLVGVYAKSHEKIWTKQDRIRALVNAYRGEHAKVIESCNAASLDIGQRELMMDGLINRFLGDLDAEREERASRKTPQEPQSHSFAAHVQRKSSETDSG